MNSPESDPPNPPDPLNPSGIRLLIFCGTLLLFLAFFKGEGGYHDLVNYLDDAEGLWLRGDMSRPDETEEVELPDGNVIERPVYSQYSLGLAFISGPFVLLGHGLERMTNGAIGARSFTVLIIPIMSALSALLIYDIGRLLGAGAKVSVWAALMFAAGTPQLTFARQFFTEAAVIFFVLAALWAFLRSVSGPTPARAPLWALAAGAGLAGAGACHYAEGPLVAALCTGMVLSYILVARPNSNEGLKGVKQPATGLFRTFQLSSVGPLARFSVARRIVCINALGLVPMLAVGAILYVNYLRRGKLFDTGYGDDVDDLGVHNIAFNCHYLFYRVESQLKLGLFVRNPWIPAAVILFLLWGRRPGSWPVRWALIAGAALEAVFWMSYGHLGYSPLRYFQPVTGVLAVTLVCLGAGIESRLPRWGLCVSGALLIAYNVVWFVLGDDHSRPMMFSPAPGDGKLLIYSWYMRPFPEGITDGYGTPPGIVQWMVLGSCLIGAAICLGLAWRRARAADHWAARS